MRGGRAAKVAVFLRGVSALDSQAGKTTVEPALSAFAWLAFTVAS